MLDLTQIAGQVAEAGGRERERRALVAEETALAAAVAQMDSELWATHVPRLRASRTSWLVAHAPAPPAARTPAPPIPPQYAVVATDGSQIAPDRHDGLATAYLLNIGRVQLFYGTGARPRLDSRAEIIPIDGDDEEAERAAVAGMAARRFVGEMAALGELAGEAAAAGLPVVALTDGSLIAWAMDDEQGDDPAKGEGLAALLGALQAGRDLGVPIVGYVSGPGSRDVVNALRITLCPENPVDCRRCPHPKEALPCAPVRRATDAAVFARLLSPGERSPVFTARGQTTGFSRILQKYDEHWVAFFYLHVGAEIARIEIPGWAADDPALVDRVHALCLDQARKGAATRSRSPRRTSGPWCAARIGRRFSPCLPAPSSTPAHPRSRRARHWPSAPAPSDFYECLSPTYRRRQRPFRSDAGQILLVKTPRRSWELPGGQVEQGRPFWP